jgi:UDP-glucose 4-epimerase
MPDGLTIAVTGPTGEIGRAFPPGIPFQLVHHDDVANALVAAARGTGPPGAYNVAGTGTITLGDVAHALGWHSIAVPSALMDVASFGAGLPLAPSLAQWVNAGRVPVVMDTAKARRELRWRPRHDTASTLQLTADAARNARVV